MIEENSLVLNIIVSVFIPCLTERRILMTTSSKEQEAKKVRVVIDKDPVNTSF